jgi:hypothetical protein
MSVTEERRDRSQRTFVKHLAERLAAAKEVAARCGPTSMLFRHRQQEYEKALGTFEATQSELNDRPPHIRFESPWLFWPPAIVVFVIEAYINKIIIDMAAQTPGGISLLVSGLLSLFLVWLAHNAGISWRQIWSDLERRVVVSSVLWGVGILFILAVFVVGLMTLRAYYALATSGSAMNVFDAVKDIASLGPSFIAQAFGVPEALTIGGLNFLALTFAFLFAFFSHDSDKEYDKRYFEMKKAKAVRDKAVVRYEREQEGVHRRFKRPIARTLRSFVGNGGESGDLPADDFKQQRHEAERALPEHGTEPRPAANPPQLVTPTPFKPAPTSPSAAQAGKVNPW